MNSKLKKSFNYVKNLFKRTKYMFKVHAYDNIIKLQPSYSNSAAAVSYKMLLVSRNVHISMCLRHVSEKTGCVHGHEIQLCWLLLDNY